MRKKRTDRNHIIYQLSNTKTGETYIGVTVLVCKAYKRTLDARWNRHVTRAFNQQHQWNLCDSIRIHGAEAFQREILEVVRGKAKAFAREAELINFHRPQLNTRLKLS